MKFTLNKSLISLSKAAIALRDLSSNLSLRTPKSAGGTDHLQEEWALSKEVSLANSARSQYAVGLADAATKVFDKLPDNMNMQARVQFTQYIIEKSDYWLHSERSGARIVQSPGASQAATAEED